MLRLPSFNGDLEASKSTVVSSKLSANDGSLFSNASSRRSKQKNSKVGIALPFPLNASMVVNITNPSSMLEPKLSVDSYMSRCKSADNLRVVKTPLPSKQRRRRTLVNGNGQYETFTSQKLGDHVSVVEALTKHRNRLSVFGGQQDGGECAQEEEIDALSRCMDFLEKKAKLGSDEEDRTLLQESIDFVRDNLFSNWLQVGCGENHKNLKTMTFAQIARKMDAKTRDQEILIHELEQNLAKEKAEVERLGHLYNQTKTRKAALKEELEALKSQDNKNMQYVNRLRRDLMTSFDEYKAMEALKDNANSLAKKRSIELSEVERKLAAQEQMTEALRERFDLAMKEHKASMDANLDLKTQLRKMEDEKRIAELNAEQLQEKLHVLEFGDSAEGQKHAELLSKRKQTMGLKMNQSRQRHLEIASNDNNNNNKKPMLKRS